MVDQSLMQLGLGAGISIAFHPMTYAKTLIQLGHEPMAPVASRSIFGRDVLVYPNVFRYVSFIKSRDGFFGMYAGLGARLCAGIVGSTVNSNVMKYLKKQDESLDREIDGDEDIWSGVNVMLINSTNEMTARCAALIVSQPFHVIMIRMMAQFVGEETKYSSMYASIGEIYHRDGILGFFVGLAPRLLGEAITIWMTNVLVHVVNEYLMPKSDETKAMKSYTNAVCTLFITQLTYPFSLVSNVMAVADSGLTIGTLPLMASYSGWRQCFRTLKAEGQLKRGSSMFFRYYKGVTRHDGKPIWTGSFPPPAFN